MLTSEEQELALDRICRLIAMMNQTTSVPNKPTLLKLHDLLPMIEQLDDIKAGLSGCLPEVKNAIF